MPSSLRGSRAHVRGTALPFWSFVRVPIEVVSVRSLRGSLFLSVGRGGRGRGFTV